MGRQLLLTSVCCCTYRSWKGEAASPGDFIRLLRSLISSVYVCVWGDGVGGGRGLNDISLLLYIEIVERGSSFFWWFHKLAQILDFLCVCVCVGGWGGGREGPYLTSVCCCTYRSWKGEAASPGDFIRLSMSLICSVYMWGGGAGGPYLTSVCCCT